LIVNSGSGKPALTFVSTNSTNGVDTYTLSGTSYPYSTGETIYSISGSDQFGNVFSDAIKISPVKILDGLSVSLTNDNASLPARSTGFVESGSFVLSSGSVSVKVGNEIISHSNGLTANNRFDVISAVATNVQTGSLNYSTPGYFITRLDADSGSLDLTIRYKDGAGDTSDTTKLVTYTKAKVGTPNVVVAVSPSAQSISSNSRGSGSASPTTLTITALEGNTSRFTSIGTPTYTNGLAGTVSTNTISFTSTASSMFSDTGQITIPVNYTDSEGVSGTKNIIATVSKSKTAVPNVVISATPQAQSVLANAAGIQTGILSNVTVSALEGTTSRFTSMTATYAGFSTNPTISGATLTMTSAVMNAAEASATIVVTHSDSEGTTGQTQTIVARFTKVNTGTAGTPGLDGADGGAGPGVVYRGDWAPNTAYFSSSIRVDVVRGSDSEYWLAKVGHTSTGTGTIDKPITGTSYTNQWRPFGATFSSVATDILLAQDATITRGLVMGTYGVSDKGFIRSATATALMTGKGYYLDTTGSMRFGDPAGQYIKFTESEGVIVAGNISAATGTFTGGVSGTGYSLNNSGLNLTNTTSSISLGNGVTLNNSGLSGTGFSLTTSGVSATSGLIGGWTINNTSISKSGISLNSTTPEILMSGSVSKVKIGTRNLVELTGADDQRTVYLGQGGVKITGDWDAVNSEYPSYITLAADSGFSKAIFFNKNVGYSSELVYMYALPYGAGSCLRIENGGARIRNYDDGSGYTGTGNGGYALQVGSISGTTATFTGDVTANTSDGRLKTNIVKIDSPLEKISKINGVYFNWNETAKELNEKDTTIREVGFIAQEVKEVLPEIVKRAAFDTIMDESITDRVEFKSKSGEEYLTIQYEKVVPLLVECIKELKNEIEELKKNK
jgi:hypothetical protein